jgi:hypothetical protein
LDNLPWNIAAGVVKLLMTDPNGVNTVIGAVLGPADILGNIYTAVASWVVIGPVGAWVRAWDVTDQNGIRQVSRPIVFNVISSPS